MKGASDPMGPGVRTYRGVASSITRSVSASAASAVRGVPRRVDRPEGRWYASALVNGKRDSAPDPSGLDEVLVRAIASGDTRALAALYDRHAPLMLGLARRIVGGTSEAEDIVHDVFVEAWRRASDYDESRGSVKAWLLLRTRSRAIDFRKSAGVARTSPTGDTAWLASLIDPRGDDVGTTLQGNV